MTGEGLDGKDLVISKLIRQDIQKYRSLFQDVSAAIQSRKHLSIIKIRLASYYRTQNERRCYSTAIRPSHGFNS
jgi:hypothetical protein